MRKLPILLGVLLVSFFLDQPVLHLMDMMQHPLLIAVMEWFSHLITVFFVLILFTALFLYEEKQYRYIGVLLVSFGLALVFSKGFKFLFMRTRPQGMQFMNLLGVELPDYAFPSTHATMGFSVLAVLDKKFERLKAFWIFLAVMIAFSRIYLYEHYLSDVVAGSILGFYIGKICLLAEERYGPFKNILARIRD